MASTFHFASKSMATQLRNVVQVAYPMVVLFIWLIAFTARSIATSRRETPVANGSAPKPMGPNGKPLPAPKPRKSDESHSLDFSRPRKLLFQWLTIGVIVSFLGNIIVVIGHALYARKDGWWCGVPFTIYLVGSFMVYLLLIITLIDTVPSPTIAHLIAWAVALVLEIIILACSLTIYSASHREPKHHGKGKLRKHMTDWEITEVSIDIARVFLLGGLISFYALFVFIQGYKHRRSSSNSAAEEETAALLANEENAQTGTAIGSSQTYGATNGKPRGSPEAPAGWEKPKETPQRNWWEYIRAYAVFLPYIWPAKDRMLQINFVICLVIVVLQRGIQFLVPYQAGVITDILAPEHGDPYMPWGAISLFIIYRVFQGSNGLLGAARQVLWIPIEQYSYRELSVAAFEHVHMLSLEFHLGKKTGEVLSALGKGAALNTFLESVTFNVMPMIADLIVAMIFFLVKFDAYYALVIAIVTVWYIYITIRIAAWRADIRRQATNASREEDAVKNDSMMSYETVKYFNAEAYEFNRYRDAVRKYQKAEYLVTFSLALMNTIQNLIFMAGLIVVCFIAAYQVTSGAVAVGDFVTLLQYMTQLQGPLNFFGTFYRMIQNNMINSERMLELFKESPTVVDGPDAKELPSCQGHIRYNDVQFSYDNRKSALKGLDFDCKPGTTTALVGESGGGKSTVFRLLFRFYNVDAGHIQIDAHDVESVTIDSLRKHIGVVPQDTVLFNETLMYNLKYANQSATDEQVFEACRAASIHDKIMGFPDGYETKVGERGLRLSGGEKQRVAIARTIIKDPRIILLDEATAALDTETEEHIQEALQTLAKGRTMLIIAHRLSTITMCDQILVLHEGRVAERGSHTELLAMKGRYAGMWRKQVRAQRAAEEAKMLKDKADRLRRESMDSSALRLRTVDAAGNKLDDDSPPSSDEDERRLQQRIQRQRAQTQNFSSAQSSSQNLSQSSQYLSRSVPGGSYIQTYETRRSAATEEQTDLQSALSLSPKAAVPHAEISSIVAMDSGTDTQPQREALRSGVIRSPSPVAEEEPIVTHDNRSQDQ